MILTKITIAGITNPTIKKDQQKNIIQRLVQTKIPTIGKINKTTVIKSKPKKPKDSFLPILDFIHLKIEKGIIAFSTKLYDFINVLLFKMLSRLLIKLTTSIMICVWRFKHSGNACIFKNTRIINILLFDTK